MTSNLFINLRLFWVIFFQASCITIALLFAFLLRFDFDIPESYTQTFQSLVVPAIGIKLLLLWVWKLHRGWWRVSIGLADMLTLLKANLAGSAGLITFAALSYRMESIPRSILILDGLFCFALLAAGRFSRRTLREHIYPLLRKKRGERVLIIGGGAAGTMLAREYRQNLSISKTHLVGFIDDDPRKQKIEIQGYPVLGTCHELPTIIAAQNINQLVIAVPSASAKEMLTIVEECRKTGLIYKTLPTLADLLEGNSLRQLKQVEIEDLLSRDIVDLENSGINTFLSGKTVLVTGAAGSIGSELCRQIAQHTPRELILLDNAETPLFNINNELFRLHPNLQQKVMVASVRCQHRIMNIFLENKPDVVFHAAAYKHVPLMEDNPEEAVCTNVIGTKNVIEAVEASKTSHFVMVSTDKAVHPSSIMGATKRLAEMVIQAYATNSTAHFVTVRFGNVLGSSGSVVPTFVEQIKRGGPVTVTHPEITRYFMTIPEASQLVLQAGGMGKGGEIFVLDMGEPVRIVSLAEELIRLSGYEPYVDIDIEYSGLRPGEKLHEELFLKEENLKTTHHSKILVAESRTVSTDEINSLVDNLCTFCQIKDKKALLDLFKTFIPDYKKTV